MAEFRFSVIPGGRGGGTTPPLDPGSGGGDDGGMDELVRRVARLEDAVVSIRDAITRLEPRIIETHSFTTAIVPTLATKVEVADLRVTLTESTAPIATLATKTDLSSVLVQLAEKPGKLYLWGMFGVIFAAFAAGAALLPLAQKIFGS